MNIPKALFVSHGGGPLPLLGDPHHREMVSHLESLSATIPKPDALIVVSAHWEERIPTITSGLNPPLIYDYHGFPAESYKIQYPCAGEPALANEIQHILNDAGIEAKLDPARGLDHGVFVPLKIMYPQADIPCVQMSLVNNLDPSYHIKIGQALSNLSRQNVLVIGSGFSFHNLRAFFAADTMESRQLNHSFEQWLMDVCTNHSYTEVQRSQMLADWSMAQGARYCHPREEHLLPLHVCYGVAQSPSSQQLSVTILNKKASMYVW